MKKKNHPIDRESFKTTASLLPLDDPKILFDDLERLGEGSFGVVHKMRDKRTKSVVALKIVPVESVKDKGIVKEIEILKQLKSVYVTRYIHSYLRAKPREIWIAMEFCDGGSLSDLMLATSAVFQENSIRSICASMLLGLVDLHKKNIIHRDVKGCNVLLTSDGRAKLADFGVSATLSSTAKRRTTIGTPLWMAPEVITNEAYSVEADIWSMGITCIELAQGTPPLSHMSPFRAMFYIPKREPPRLEKPQDYTTQFSNFLKRCLTKDRNKRSHAEILLSDPFVCDQVDEFKRSGGVSEALRTLVKSTEDARLAFRRGVEYVIILASFSSLSTCIVKTQHTHTHIHTLICNRYISPENKKTGEKSYGELDLTFGSAQSPKTPRGMAPGTLVVKQNSKDGDKKSDVMCVMGTFVKKNPSSTTTSSTLRLGSSGGRMGNKTVSNQSNIESNGTLIIGVGMTMGDKTASNQSNIESNGTLIIGGEIGNNKSILNNTTYVRDEKKEEEEEGQEEAKRIRSPPHHNSGRHISGNQHDRSHHTIVEKGGGSGLFSSIFCCF